MSERRTQRTERARCCVAHSFHLLRIETTKNGGSCCLPHPFTYYTTSRVLILSCLPKVLGPPVVQVTRGSQVSLRTETGLSACSSLTADEALPSYSWSLVAANESLAREQLTVEVGRDPRVLVIPPYTLGFAGSSYLFQFRSAFGGANATTASATGERFSKTTVVQFRGGLVCPPGSRFHKETKKHPAGGLPTHMPKKGSFLECLCFIGLTSSVVARGHQASPPPSSAFFSPPPSTRPDSRSCQRGNCCCNLWRLESIYWNFAGRREDV